MSQQCLTNRRLIAEPIKPSNLSSSGISQKHFKWYLAGKGLVVMVELIWVFNGSIECQRNYLFQHLHVTHSGSPGSSRTFPLKYTLNKNVLVTIMIIIKPLPGKQSR